MNVNGIGQNYYQNNMAATKSTKGINSAEKADGFAGKVAEKRSVSPEDMLLCQDLVQTKMRYSIS